MIASIHQAVPVSSHDQFLALLPRIRRQANIAFRKTHREAREELVQETVASAFRAFTSLVRRGKAELAYATPLADYAIRQVCAGRRVGQVFNGQDLTSPKAPARGRAVIECLYCFDAEKRAWQEILVEDRKAGPAETAAARIDVAAWFRSMGTKKRRIAKALAHGETTTAVGQRFSLSAGRISQIRRELEYSWDVFQSEAAEESVGAVAM